MEALLASATRLFAERGIEGASVRDVAADAGVNHALVFRHFGSKAGLVRSVLDRLLDDLLAELARAGVDAEALATVGESVAGHEVLWKLLTRAVLDGEVDFLVERRFPELDRAVSVLEGALAASPEPLDVDPRLLLVIVICGSLGWVLLDPLLATAVGAPGDTPWRRRDLAREGFGALMGLAPPGSDALGPGELGRPARAPEAVVPAPGQEGPLRPVAAGPAGPPRGRDEVVRALTDAAMGLFAHKSPAAVSVRDLAAAAGVNHALVFRHFGSKEGLVHAVWARVVEELAGVEMGAPDYEALTALTESLAEEDRIWKLLARAIVEGETEIIGAHRYRFVEVLVHAAARDQEAGLLRARIHPRLLVAMICALGFGWLVLHPVLLPLVGLEGDAAEERARLRHAVMKIVGWRRPGPEAPAPL